MATTVSDVYLTFKVANFDGTQETIYGGVPELEEVRRLKRRIAEKQRGPERTLLFMGEEMDPSRTLKSYGVKEGSLIRAVDIASEPQRPVTPPPQYEPGTHILEQVFVLDSFGANARTMTIRNLPITTNITEFKKIVGRETGYDENEIKLLFGGKEFKTHNTFRGEPKTLKDYGLQNESTVHLLYRVLGGDVMRDL